MRLQELHPALVHFPISLLPASLAIDAMGRATGKREWMDLGQKGIGLAFASVALAGVAGLLAQEAVELDEDSRRKLVTHRTLNLGLLGLTGILTRLRRRADRPSLGYLALGMAGVGVMTYSAYLGGNMVYQDGVGVAAAGGVREEEAPHLEPAEAGEALRASGRHIVSGARHTIEDFSHREVLPWLTREHGERQARDIGELQPVAVAPDGVRPGVEGMSTESGTGEV